MSPEPAARPDPHVRRVGRVAAEARRHREVVGPSVAARGSSSTGSGMSRRWRCGENTIQRIERLPPMAADHDRLAETDPGAECAADERPDRDRAPDEEAHHRVHASLEPRRTDRLPIADLDDVVDDDREAAEEHRGDEEREWLRCRPGRSAKSSVDGPHEHADGDGRGARCRTASRDASRRTRRRTTRRSPIENASPITAAESSSSRTRYTRMIANATFEKKFEVAVQPACARRFGFPRTKRSPSFSSRPEARLAAVDGLPGTRGSSRLRMPQEEQPRPEEADRVDEDGVGRGDQLRRARPPGPGPPT